MAASWMCTMLGHVITHVDLAVDGQDGRGARIGLHAGLLFSTVFGCSGSTSSFPAFSLGSSATWPKHAWSA
eukprot:2645191-Amphidinium_carterae.1